MKSLWSYQVLIPVALFLGLAPLQPEPHLLEKVRMLAAGTLIRPLDIFDLLWHVWPLSLLLLKAGRDLGSRLLLPGKK